MISDVPEYLKSPELIPVLSVYKVLGCEFKYSDCKRRKYAAGLIDRYGNLVKITTNKPFACKNGCDRIIKNIPHGTRYEECSSIHAEQALFVEASGFPFNGYSMVLRGYDMEINDEIEAIPCKICARIILHSGIDCIYTSERRYNAKAFCYDIIMR